MATPHEFLDNSNPLMQRTFGFAAAAGSYTKLFSEVDSEFLESVSALTFKDYFELIPQSAKAFLEYKIFFLYSLMSGKTKSVV